MNHMATTGNRGGGQRSKGERRFVGTRVPVRDHDLLVAAAAAHGLTVSEYVAETLVEKLNSENFSHTDLQEELPIGQMAS